jgi:hypothetical protein
MIASLVYCDHEETSTFHQESQIMALSPSGDLVSGLANATHDDQDEAMPEYVSSVGSSAFQTANTYMQVDASMIIV